MDGYTEIIPAVLVRPITDIAVEQRQAGVGAGCASEGASRWRAGNQACEFAVPRPPIHTRNGGISILRCFSSLPRNCLATSGKSRKTFFAWSGSSLQLYRHGPLPWFLPRTF